MRDIGKNIRALRIRKKMTQDRLAELLFVTRQTVSNYETGKSRPDIDMLMQISEVLDADIQQVLYGIPRPGRRKELTRALAGGILILLLSICWSRLIPVARLVQQQHFTLSLNGLIHMLVIPLLFLTVGWTVAQIATVVLQRKPLCTKWTVCIRIFLLVIILSFFIISVWYTVIWLLNDWEIYHRIGGSYVQSEQGQHWVHQDILAPEWVRNMYFNIAYSVMRYLPVIMSVLGAALCLFRFPERKKHQIPQE